MKEPKIKPIKMSVKDVMSFEFSNLIQKLINSPTSNKNASLIHKIYKEIDRNATQIKEDFKTAIIEPYAMKDDQGKVVLDAGGHYAPNPEKLEEYNKAMTEFEAREIEINWRPLTPDTLQDMKITAREIDLLGPLYSEQSGPGVPHLQGLPTPEHHPN